MPIYGLRDEPGQLQFITTSTYRRTKLFQGDRFRWIFVQVLRELRQQTCFLLTGWMPYTEARDSVRRRLVDSYPGHGAIVRFHRVGSVTSLHQGPLDTP